MGETELDSVTRDLQSAAGGVAVVPLLQAARMLQVSGQTLRRAVWTGSLTATRRTKNGALYFRCRELARFLLDGESRSLPVNVAVERRAAAQPEAGTHDPPEEWT